MGNFCDKNTKTTLHEIYAHVFLRFSDSSKPSQSVLLTYKMTWLAEIRKSDENLLKSCKVAPVTKVQITYFGDVTTIENNREVRVNIDATLVAMFRIAPSIRNIATNFASMFTRTRRLSWRHLDCLDVIKICGQLWSQEQPYTKFWASFPKIYRFQHAKQIRKLAIQIGLACWKRKI